MKKIFILITLFYSCFKTNYSQPGRLDPSFGTNGIVRTGIGAIYNYNFDNSSTGRQVLLQPGGGIFVIINAPVLNGTVIAKRLSNGSADVKYGNKGFSASVPVNDPHAAFQPNGKIVVVGWTYRRFISAISLARYNIDGSLDSTFNRDRNEIIDFGTNLSIAIQSDGKIVVAGYAANGYEDTNFALARYNADGSLDTSFGKNGKQITDFGLKLPADMNGTYPESNYATSVIIQNNGKIVAAGYAFNYASSTYDFALARYNTNGSPDNTFDGDGKKTTDFGSSDDYANAVTIQSDGKIVVAGSSNTDFALARYNTNGSLDKTFDRDGKQTTDFGSSNDIGSSVAVQNDGKIVVSGYILNGSNSDFALARFNNNGSPDNTFSRNGKQTKDFGSSDDYANSIAIQSDGKIVIEGYTSAGSHSDFALARFNTDGSQDNTFNGKGKLNDIPKQGFTDYTCTAIQKDGKIIAAGYSWNGKNFDFALARYTTDGSLDSTFSNDGKQMTDFASSDDQASAVIIQSDGKIVLAGVSNADFALARYNTDGSLDISFNKNGKQITDFAFSEDKAASVAIQSDGKIVAAGTSNADFALARYNTNGSLDKTFSKDGKQTTGFGSSDDNAYSVAIQKDGKIVVAGSTVFYIESYSNADFALARYNTDGSLDLTFDRDGKQTTTFGYMYNFAYALAIQSDGKIVAGGYTGDPSLFALARYNTNGSLDNTFSDDGMQTTDFRVEYSIANSVAIQDNGKILLAGYVWKEDGLNFGIARYSTEGSLDQSFSEDGIEITEASEGDNFINGIAIAHNKLYAAGTGRYPGDLGVVARYVLEENKAPVVSIAIPGNVVKYTSPATIKINATATDEDGTIKKVQFYNGTTLLHTEKVFPYGFLWKNIPAGNYTITAKATDNTGLVTTSDNIKVAVANYNVAPVVRIVTPEHDTTYTGPATIRLIAKAKDPNDKISKLEFYNGKKLLRTEYYYPYTYTWMNVQPGTYTITAKATDDKGLSATSEPVTITVTNATTVSHKPTSADNKIDKLSLKLAPNPASSILQVFTNGFQQNKSSIISVISAAGVVVKSIQLNNSSKVVQLDVSSLVSGVYSVKIVSGDKVVYKQFVKL